VASTKRDLPTGIRRLHGTYQAYLTYRDRFYSQTFPLDTALSTMKEWRGRKRAELKYGVHSQPGRTFSEDADDYLKMCAGMTSYVDQKYRIEQWVQAFGPRDRRSITAADIRRQLEAWRVSGRFDGKGLSTTSLNHRRTVLMAMYTTLDGKSQPNIVKDVPPYPEPWRHQIRAQPMLTVARAMRHTEVRSKTRARLYLFMWSGWSNALVKALTPADVDWKKNLVKLPPRHKGEGMSAAWVRVLPQTMRALRRFFAVNAQGKFSNSSLHSSWVLACKSAGGPVMRVYDIRNSFATWVAPLIKDDRALKELLRTNSIERYTQGAALLRLEQAIQGLQGRTRFQRSSGGHRPRRAKHRTRQKTA